MCGTGTRLQSSIFLHVINIGGCGTATVFRFAVIVTVGMATFVLVVLVVAVGNAFIARWTFGQAGLELLDKRSHDHFGVLLSTIRSSRWLLFELGR